MDNEGGRVVRSRKRSVVTPRMSAPVDNELLSTLQHEYLLMDQEHARIRAEALATHNPELQAQARSAKSGS